MMGAALLALWLTASGTSIVVDIAESELDAAGKPAPSRKLNAALVAALKADGFEVKTDLPADLLMRGNAEARPTKKGVLELTGGVRVTEVGSHALVAAVPLNPGTLVMTVQAIMLELHNSTAPARAKPSGTAFTLRVVGVSFAEVGELEKELAKAQGVAAVEATEFENDTQVFTVTFGGDPKQLAKVLSTVVVNKKSLAVIAKGGTALAGGFRQ